MRCESIICLADNSRTRAAVYILATRCICCGLDPICHLPNNYIDNIMKEEEKDSLTPSIRRIIEESNKIHQHTRIGATYADALQILHIEQLEKINNKLTLISIGNVAPSILGALSKTKTPVVKCRRCSDEEE